MDALTEIMRRLEDCVQRGVFESLETDGLEIKPVPSTGNAWISISESICSFLNTRGGVVLLGVKEEKKPNCRYVFTSYTENHSTQLSDLRKRFTDVSGSTLDVSDFLRFEILPFSTGQVALVRVAPIPEERKFCFLNGVAFDRVADQDQKISKSRIEVHEERKREMEYFRELAPVEESNLEDFSLDRVNATIRLINLGQPIETLKADLNEAVAFLRRRRFLTTDGRATTLGILLAGLHPVDLLMFRCQLDAFVESSVEVARDKKTFRDNVMQLMEWGQAWIWRNI